MGIFGRLREQPGAERDVSPEKPAALSAAGSTPRPPTPLSDLMTRVLQDGSDEAWDTFCDAFMRSRVGVIATEIAATEGDGPPPAQLPKPTPPPGWHTVPAGRVAFGKAATPDGRVMLAACADRDAFVRNFHDRFNREVMGWELAQTVLVIPDCEGILVNSAASFRSLALDRARLARMVVRQRQPAGPKKI